MRDRQLFEEQMEIFERVGNHPIGDLFSADFEQEGQIHWVASCG